MNVKRRTRVPRSRRSAVAIGIAALSWSACASHRGASARMSQPSLAQHIARVRAVSAAATSRSSASTPTLESWDPQLSAVLTELAVAPTADGHRRVAVEYRRLGVLDMAHAHLTAAVRLAPHDAAAFDELARIWRDWGFPQLGFSDAYRAVYLAPSSAAAANTLGTLFEAAGQTREARLWYERALALDPGASYALNNLCYTAVMLRQRDAVTACRRGLAVAPDSRRARNNLGLAYAARGELDKAREQFESSSNVSAGPYNMGIVYMARRQFEKATDAFETAVRINPGFSLAAARVRQARAAARTEADPPNGEQNPLTDERDKGEQERDPR